MSFSLPGGGAEGGGGASAATRVVFGFGSRVGDSISETLDHGCIAWSGQQSLACKHNVAGYSALHLNSSFCLYLTIRIVDRSLEPAGVPAGITAARVLVNAVGGEICPR